MATATTTGTLKGLDFKGATESFFLGRRRGVSLEFCTSVERAALKKKDLQDLPLFLHFILFLARFKQNEKRGEGGRRSGFEVTTKRSVNGIALSFPGLLSFERPSHS